MTEEIAGSFQRRLKEFLDSAIAQRAGIEEIRCGKDDNPLVTGMEYDSRKIKPGNLFFALPGLHTNGALFINDALKAGASVIVHGEGQDVEAHTGAVFARARDPRFAISALADAFYDHPSRHLGVIGVTGTEGKSTTVYLIYQLLSLLGFKTGFISTVRLGNGNKEIENPEHQTTPEASTVHRFLAEMRKNNAVFAVVEASSHGLSKRTNRLGDVCFDVGVMTNVNHEHLEFHGTWEQYRNDKTELFRALDLNDKGRAWPCFGVVNADDPSASFFSAATTRDTYSFTTKGTQKRAKVDLALKFLESTGEGNCYEVNVEGLKETIRIRDRLPGAFNAGNVLASLLVVTKLLSKNPSEIAELVQKLKPVRGRMTPVEQGQPFEVLVDYAHTPSSFQTIFPPLRERLNAAKGRIIVVFGSPGERDTIKRSEQGRVADKYADLVILTDEDPRTEDPMAILEEIARGVQNKTRGKDLFLIPDRPEALRKAFSLACPEDLVLRLGKGHENSIIYANETRPYDEIKEAATALAEMGFKP
jgi:UDP-N-acetylmuramoyl-L-alanyl-D-glutamate--2,6-diaminopimelate ligase